MKKQDARGLNFIELTGLRQRAVSAVQAGESPEIVARVMGVSRGAVYGWLARYRQGGWTALTARKRGGRPPFLNGDHLEKLKQLLSQGATSHGWINNLWTAKRVSELIRREFNVPISAKSVHRILKKELGWTYQKPIHRSYQRDEDEIDKWKTETFKRIRKTATKKKAYLVFIDETGFMLSPLSRRTYAPKGQTPVVKVADPHGRISVISAITVSPIKNRTNLFFHLLPDNLNFNSQDILNFVKRLQFLLRKPVTLVWDSIPIHCSGLLVNFLSEHPDMDSEVFPPYAPELNPVDRVWSYLKYNRLANYTPSDLCQLRSTVNEELLRLRTKKDFLRSFIHNTGLHLGM